MTQKRITIQNEKGFDLAAELLLPIDQKPIAYGIFAHCFTCNKNLNAVRNIAESLRHNGIAILSFDFTGLGSSEGDFADSNFSSNVEDILSAANWLAENHESPKLLIGHSLGGAAVVMAASRLKDILAVATVAAPASPDHVIHLFEEKEEEVKEKGCAQVNIGGRPFVIKEQFLQDVTSHDLSDDLKSLKKSLLIMHSPQDQIVDIQNAQKMYESAMHPKSFVSLDGADHLLSDKADSDYVGELIASWAKRYLPPKKQSELKTNERVVVQIGADGYTCDILADKHRLRADEPEDVGGNDYGPDPYELLLSSLGACTVMTLRMYADRKKWELEEVKVHLNHEKDYPKNCENCDEKSRIDQITRKIELKGNLSEEQKKRLIEIANRCPVHRTLHSPVEVYTESI
ncbi:bifunctional alpha/beta hydrolase/OsmC family protein [Reichenbachiella ulvae]|uniref:Bifunctional alpha/beta hydrolase/OsmC family protein n=1 Tax=Reichenbachiella ulvae TaxID=2980104 RepID=A0ABT3CX81_9BACT|nr:bifunctional alpha/beta hydrolase/OsmC family protein [Reichenbachiella ulvae]MCV9388301.1 bifunctional alpha/beta hydrolase/OsmC family protein [Reichenbachiella ulvae]